ncbi:MAG: DUF3883 domain-containing protein [Gemmatimonadales bacterium]|nr:DUF3883 domain-containing protein [Gemmatimonadales bacterium]
MAATGGVSSPREVIDRIRTEDYLLDIEQESDRVRRGAKSLHKKLNSALDLLSKDLYSKKSHFILELIQNADDNEYVKGTVPQLTFKLAPGRLVLLNNEIGFSERNVQALCSVGDSSKAKKSGYIGEKGIGFKSVFTVSNAPEIHSNGFHFRFDRRDEANLLGYVVPEWCEPPEEAKPETTAIVLPAAQGYEFSKETLEDLDARLLLFLSKLREIELLHGDERTTFRRRDRKGLSVLTTEIARPGAEPKIDECRFVRVSVDFSMEKVPDEKRPEISTSSVVLAFPVDASGAADPQPASQVFAFLPIRQVGFKFSIQADFILSSSREDILTDRAWNKLLREGIAVAFKVAVATFRASDALAFSYLKYLPGEGEISDPFFRSLTDSIVAQLAQTECLPSEGGQWKCPSDLRIAEKRFRDLFPPAVAMELFGFDYVDHRVQGGNDLLRRLGAKSITFADIFNVFKLHGDWLKKQNIEWKARFYAMLAELDLQKLVAGLVALPCIPTNAGELVVPSKSHVFYPLSRGKKFGFEQELVIIDSDLLDEAQAHSEKVHALFAALQVKSDDPYDLVTSHILPRHQGDSWKTSERKALLGHLRYIKDKLKEYLEGAAAAGKTESQAFQAVRDGIWVGTKQSADQWLFSKPQQLYLSKEYGPAFCMETLLGEAIPRSLLVSADYLAAKPKDPEAEAESWRTFLIRLGARVAPRLEAAASGDSKCSAELQLLLGSQQSAVRRATLECLDNNWSQYAGHLSFALQVGRTVTNRETQFSVALRSMLAPTRKRVSPPISEVFYPTPELKGLFGERLTYIDATLSSQVLDACGVTHRLDAKACLKRLRQLKAEGGDTTPQLHALYRHLEQFWDKEGAVIKQAFSLEGLIRIKGANPVWAKPTEVAWRSNGPFLDSLYPPLQGQYRDFSGFFNEKLGIPKELPTGKWVEALSKLGQIESIHERRREALAIYKRANRDLTPRFGRDEIPTPGWLSAFEGNEVFLNHRDELVSNDEQLFANDAPELAALFTDEADISLLAVSYEEVPRIERLLNAAEVPRLSSSVVVELVEASGGHLESDLTSKVRRAIPYLGRVLYAKSHDRFEGAAEQGLFRRLRDLEVIEVPELKLSLTLAQTSRTTIADIAPSEGSIFIRAGARSIKDQLAAELCKLLEAPLDLADTFARVLMEEDADGVEDFLRVRRVGQLPADLLELLTEGGARQPSDGESSGDEDATGPGYEEGAVQPPATDVEPPAAESPPASDSGGGRGASSHSAVGPGGRAASNGTDGATQSGPSASPVRVPTPNVSSGTAGSGSASPSPRPQQPPQGGASSAQLGGRLAPESGEQTGGSMGRTEVSRQAQDLPSSGATNALQPRKGGAAVGPAGGSRKKRGHGNRHRTKAGRLMSYAAAPGDADRPGGDDPAKAAAREALGKAAVEYFLATQASRWKSLVPMPHNNPGFDVKAIAHDGADEFIEVKGQGAGWTEDGVALTPTELMTAQKHGDRYWLCVVEHVQDEKRRALYLLQNPYGLTQQFRFDSGWKTAAIGQAAVPLKPAVGLFVEIPGVGRGRILSFKKANQFYKLHVMLDGGGQANKLFNPATMKLSAE